MRSPTHRYCFLVQRSSIFPRYCPVSSLPECWVGTGSLRRHLGRLWMFADCARRCCSLELRICFLQWKPVGKGIFISLRAHQCLNSIMLPQQKERSGLYFLIPGDVRKGKLASAEVLQFLLRTVWRNIAAFKKVHRKHCNASFYGKLILKKNEE